MRFPFWLPYPKAWLQAIVLFFSLLPIYALQSVLIRCVGISFLMSDLFNNRQAFVSFFTFLGGIVLVLVPVFLLSHIHQLFWGDPHPKLPKFIPAPKSLLRGSVDWAFNVFGLIVAIVLWIDVADSYGYRSIPDSLIWIIISTWFIIVAYLYHFWFFLGRRWQRVREKFKKKDK